MVQDLMVKHGLRDAEETGRHVRKASIGMNFFYHSFLKGGKSGWVRGVVDAPSDTKVMAIHINHETNSVDLLLEHESFPLVPDCVQVPNNVMLDMLQIIFPDKEDCREAFKELGHVDACRCAACRVILFVQENQ